MALSELPQLKRITCSDDVANPKAALVAISFLTPTQIYNMKWDIEDAMPELSDEEKEIHYH